MPPSAKDNSFDGVSMFLCTLHVPYDSKQYYSVAKGWKDFYTIDNDADIKLTILKNIENAGQIIGSTSYMNGETTNITAVANGGYKFVEWTDEDGQRITDKPVLSIVATKSCVFHAVFAPLSNNGNVTYSVNGNSITLNWKPNSQVKYYKILLYTNPEMTEVAKEITVDANGNVVTRAAVNDLKAEITGLDAFTTYYYRVVGYDAEDNVLDVFAGTFETSEDTAIEVVSADDDSSFEIYNLNGEQMNQMTRGFNIIRTKDNGTRKILIK